MIDLETVTRIRQLHHGEQWPVGTIATELGLHHETVEGALKEESRTKPAPRPSRFDPYLGFVRETLAKYPQLRAPCPAAGGMGRLRDRRRALGAP